MSRPGIRANPGPIGTQGFAGGINSAILRYVGAHEVEPTTPLIPAINPLVESNLSVCEDYIFKYKFVLKPFITQPLENPGAVRPSHSRYAPGGTDISASSVWTR